MSSFKQLNVAAKANAGVKIAVVIPGGEQGDGIETGDTLTVLSTYSERFRKAEAEGFRRIREAIKQGQGHADAVSDELYEEIALNSIAHLVADWSYDEPCTLENVAEFLQANPHMYDIVNRQAADHTAFFVNAANS